MELRQTLTLLGKWLWLVLLSIGIAAVSGYLASRLAAPRYRTRTTLMVGQVTQNPALSSADLLTGQQLAHTYAQLALRQPVLQGALQSLALPWDWTTLAAQVNASVVQPTQLLEIAVVDIDPTRAKALADAIAQELILQGPHGPESLDQDQVRFAQAQLADLQAKIEAGQAEAAHLNKELDAANSARRFAELRSQADLMETKIGAWQSAYSQLLLGLQGGEVNALNVVEPAAIPTRPFTPDIPLNVLLSACLGLVLAVAGISLLEYLDDTFHTGQDLARLAHLPALAEIGCMPGAGFPELPVAVRDPGAPVVEAFRLMGLSLQASMQSRSPHSLPLALMITSPTPGDGKTTCLANLAVVMAQAGLKVITVDANLYNPALHRIFGLPNGSGLGNALVDPESDLCERLNETGVANLRLLTAGELPAQAASLLDPVCLGEIITALKTEADLVLFDSPACLDAAAPAILGACVDGAVLVASAGRTRLVEVQRAVEQLSCLRVHLLGVVLNRRPGKGPGKHIRPPNSGHTEQAGVQKTPGV